MTLLQRPDEGEAATGVIADDDQQFAEWYHATWPRVVRAVAVFTGDRDLAMDDAADAFTRAFQRWDRPDRPDDPTRWVIAVAINGAKKRSARDTRRRHLVATSAGRPVVEMGTADVDVWDAVRDLPPREREAVALRYAADLTERQVAVAMGVTPGAVAATLSSARSKLRTHLKETHDGR